VPTMLSPGTPLGTAGPPGRGVGESPTRSQPSDRPDQAPGRRHRYDGATAGHGDAILGGAVTKGGWLFGRPWLVILVAGAPVLGVSALITSVTQDVILVPELIIVGSFLAPVATMVFALTRRHEHRIESQTILVAFLLSGTLALVVSALLETYLLPKANFANLGVGLIEESCKGAIVVIVAHLWVRTRAPRDGLILGAVVGAGFAAFESSGYAMATMLADANKHPVLNILQTEYSRALYTPFAHITWTALLGGALFYAAQGRDKFRVTPTVLWTFAGIVVLHGSWDASYGLAINLTKGLLGEGWRYTPPNTASWVGSPTGTELLVWNLIYNTLLIVIGVIGCGWVRHRYRLYGHGKRLQPSGI
jgi:protease PrsW